MHPVGCLKNIFCFNICFAFVMSPCIWAVMGGLNLLMRCHEQRKVRNLAALHWRSVYQEEHRGIHTNLAGIPSVKAWKEGKWYELYAGACILYVYSSLHSYHDQRLKMGAKWPAFLGVNAWSDNIEGWILSHFTLARCGRTNSCAAYVLAYVLAFTGNPTLSASMSLINSYTGGFRMFSSLLNSENCLHLTM